MASVQSGSSGASASVADSRTLQSDEFPGLNIKRRNSKAITKERWEDAYPKITRQAAAIADFGLGLVEFAQNNTAFVGVNMSPVKKSLRTSIPRAMADWESAKEFEKMLQVYLFYKGLHLMFILRRITLVRSLIINTEAFLFVCGNDAETSKRFFLTAKTRESTNDTWIQTLMTSNAFYQNSSRLHVRMLRKWLTFWDKHKQDFQHVNQIIANLRDHPNFFSKSNPDFLKLLDYRETLIHGVFDKQRLSIENFAESMLQEVEQVKLDFKTRFEAAGKLCHNKKTTLQTLIVNNFPPDFANVLQSIDIDEPIHFYPYSQHTFDYVFACKRGAVVQFAIYTQRKKFPDIQNESKALTRVQTYLEAKFAERWPEWFHAACDAIKNDKFDYIIDFESMLKNVSLFSSAGEASANAKETSPFQKISSGMKTLRSAASTFMKTFGSPSNSASAERQPLMLNSLDDDNADGISIHGTPIRHTAETPGAPQADSLNRILQDDDAQSQQSQVSHGESSRAQLPPLMKLTDDDIDALDAFFTENNYGVELPKSQTPTQRLGANSSPRVDLTIAPTRETRTGLVVPESATDVVPGSAGGGVAAPVPVAAAHAAPPVSPAAPSIPPAAPSIPPVAPPAPAESKQRSTEMTENQFLDFCQLVFRQEMDDKFVADNQKDNMWFRMLSTERKNWDKVAANVATSLQRINSEPVLIQKVAYANPNWNPDSNQTQILWMAQFQSMRDIYLLLWEMMIQAANICTQAIAIRRKTLQYEIDCYVLEEPLWALTQYTGYEPMERAIGKYYRTDDMGRKYRFRLKHHGETLRYKRIQATWQNFKSLMNYQSQFIESALDARRMMLQLDDVVHKHLGKWSLGVEEAKTFDNDEGIDKFWEKSQHLHELHALGHANVSVEFALTQHIVKSMQALQAADMIDKIKDDVFVRPDQWIGDPIHLLSELRQVDRVKVIDDTWLERRQEHLKAIFASNAKMAATQHLNPEEKVFQAGYAILPSELQKVLVPLVCKLPKSNWSETFVHEMTRTIDMGPVLKWMHNAIEAHKRERLHNSFATEYDVAVAVRHRLDIERAEDIAKNNLSNVKQICVNELLDVDAILMPTIVAEAKRPFMIQAQGTLERQGEISVQPPSSLREMMEAIRRVRDDAKRLAEGRRPRRRRTKQQLPDAPASNRANTTANEDHNEDEEQGEEKEAVDTTERKADSAKSGTRTSKAVVSARKSKAAPAAAAAAAAADKDNDDDDDEQPPLLPPPPPPLVDDEEKETKDDARQLETWLFDDFQEVKLQSNTNMTLQEVRTRTGMPLLQLCKNHPILSLSRTSVLPQEARLITGGEDNNFAAFRYNNSLIVQLVTALMACIPEAFAEVKKSHKNAKNAEPNTGWPFVVDSNLRMLLYYLDNRLQCRGNSDMFAKIASVCDTYSKLPIEFLLLAMFPSKSMIGYVKVQARNTETNASFLEKFEGPDGQRNLTHPMTGHLRDPSFTAGSTRFCVIEFAPVEGRPQLQPTLEDMRTITSRLCEGNSTDEKQCRVIVFPLCYIFSKDNDKDTNGAGAGKQFYIADSGSQFVAQTTSRVRFMIASVARSSNVSLLQMRVIGTVPTRTCPFCGYVPIGYTRSVPGRGKGDASVRLERNAPAQFENHMYMPRYECAPIRFFGDTELAAEDSESLNINDGGAPKSYLEQHYIDNLQLRNKYKKVYRIICENATVREFSQLLQQDAFDRETVLQAADKVAELLFPPVVNGYNSLMRDIESAAGIGRLTTNLFQKLTEFLATPMRYIVKDALLCATTANKNKSNKSRKGFAKFHVFDEICKLAARVLVMNVTADNIWHVERNEEKQTLTGSPVGPPRSITSTLMLYSIRPKNVTLSKFRALTASVSQPRFLKRMTFSRVAAAAAAASSSSPIVVEAVPRFRLFDFTPEPRPVEESAIEAVQVNFTQERVSDLTDADRDFAMIGINYLMTLQPLTNSDPF